MSVIKDVSPQYVELRDLFTKEGDPEFLQKARQNAMKFYEEAPVPRFERSEMARRNLDAFAVARAETGAAWEEIVRSYLGDAPDAAVLVVADGQVVLARGLERVMDSGVVFKSLREAASSHADTVQTHLGSVVPFTENKLIALQSALWRNGAFLYVPKNVELTEPLLLLSVTTVGGYGTFSRNLIVAEPNSRVTFVEAHLMDGAIADELHVGVTEVVVQEGAAVKIGAIHDTAKKATNVVVRRAQVAKSGQMDWVVGEVSDGYTVEEVGSQLIGVGSRSTSHAIALGTGHAHLDITAKMEHIGKCSESDTAARGVMQGKALGIYRGFTQIRKGASGAIGEQVEKLLMLSPQSRGDAIPMLLIDENDVKCGHAASVGQINEEQLFYLMSRGISEKEAKRLIVWGFIDPILSGIPIDIVRQAVENILERKMA